MGPPGQMRIRAAVLDDAPAMGRLMVESWLSAHRGQVPAEAYRRRVDEWTPQVSARAWARLLAALAEDRARREVLLVAEDEAGDLVALVYGASADDEPTAIARIAALYVATAEQRRGVGRAMLLAASRDLESLGYSELQIGVLTDNQPARRFYEAMGGVESAHRMFDEDGYLVPETVYAWPLGTS